MNGTYLSKLKIGAAPVVLGIALISTPAWAQSGGSMTTDADDASTIVVTGSRIARPEVEGAAPLIATVGSEELKRRAVVNVADMLEQIPGFGIPVNGAGDQSEFTLGQNFANLFGIGSQRTLTLVNGRRFISSNTASNFGGAEAGLQVDLNVIPVSLIDRVDVLAVKGATTYGSDAIAGTVNLILKDNFEGVEATASYGLSGRGDLANVSGSLTLGSNFSEDRGNFAINLEYNKSDGIMANSRDRVRQGLFFDSRRSAAASPFRQVLYQGRRIAAITAGGAPTFESEGIGGVPRFGGFTNADGDVVRFDRSGNLVAFDLGSATGGVVNAEGGDGFNLNDVSQILSDTERFTTFALGHYDVNDRVTLFVEANYAHVKARELANQPVYNSALFSEKSVGLGMLVSNPFLNNQARDIILRPENLGADGPNFDTDGDGVNDDTRFYLQRAHTDLLGTNPARSEMDLFRAVTGLRGDFDVGDRAFNWNVSYAWGRSKSTSYQTSLVHQNFLNAVDVVADPVSGDPVCRITVDPASSLNVTGTGSINPAGSCVPLNLFGQGAPDQRAIDYVTAMTVAESANTQTVLNANVGGELFNLGTNPVAFNIGYERRTEKQSFTPDGFLQLGLGRSVAITPVTGRFRTSEFFGEIFVPIIQPSDNGFIHLAEVDGSVRYIDNSRSGSNTIWSVGGRVAPIAGLTVRGSYTQSVRQPSVTELFLPEVSVFSFADDPCDADFIADGTNPAARAANCAAEGIPVGFESTIADASQMIRSSGNMNLTGEKSKSWTAGFVLEPTFAPRLVLTADWVNIKISDAIIDASLDDIMASCYDSSDYPNTENCSRFERDPVTFQIVDALTSYLNAAEFRFAGLQASLRYSMNVGSGTLGFLGRYFYMDKYERVLNNVVDTFDGEIGYSKHEALATLTYDVNGTGIAFTGRFMSGAKYNNEAAPDAQSISKVDDFYEFDLGLSQEVNDRFTIRATVMNLFDVKPPYPLANSITYNSALLGRRFRIGASVKF